MVQAKKPPASLAYLGVSAIATVMAFAVFVGGANAGGCPRSKSAEATSTEAHQKADEKTEAEA